MILEMADSMKHSNFPVAERCKSYGLKSASRCS